MNGRHTRLEASRPQIRHCGDAEAYSRHLLDQFADFFFLVVLLIIVAVKVCTISFDC